MSKTNLKATVISVPFAIGAGANILDNPTIKEFIKECIESPLGLEHAPSIGNTFTSSEQS